jgi:hypothetical protein
MSFHDKDKGTFDKVFDILAALFISGLVAAYFALFYNTALYEGGLLSSFCTVPMLFIMITFFATVTYFWHGMGFLAGVATLVLVCGLSMHYGPFHLVGFGSTRTYNGFYQDYRPAEQRYPDGMRHK